MKAILNDQLLIISSFEGTNYSFFKMNFQKLLILLLIFILACKKNETKSTFDSDYIIENHTTSSIEVHTSLHNDNGSGSAFSIDFITAGNSINILNTEVEENAAIRIVFHDIRIFQSGTECSMDELNNANWGKEKSGEKFEYTLSVDTTFFD